MLGGYFYKEILEKRKIRHNKLIIRFVELKVRESVSEDDEDIDNLVTALMGFLSIISTHKKMRALIKQSIQEVLYLFVKYLQITEDDVLLF